MKLTPAILLMTMSLLPWAAAQTVYDLRKEEPVTNDRENVYQAGDLIEKKNTATTERSSAVAADGVHFFEGFASESSEEALLAQVEKSILKDPEHACEIVKEAIVVSRADEKLVAKIVETACLAAPEKMRIIAQCAIAAYPDGLAPCNKYWPSWIRQRETATKSEPNPARKRWKKEVSTKLLWWHL